MFIKFNLKYAHFWFVLVSIILVSVYAYLLFAHVGNHAFIDWDEGIYAQVAKESLEYAPQASLTYFGQPWFEKPPLLFWLTSVSFKIFGSTEFAARFLIALCGVITMALAGYCSLVLFKSRLAALLTLAAFFFFPQVFASTFFLNTDTLLSLWVLLAMLGFALVSVNTRWWLLFFMASGLAIMTKGVAGLFPFIIAALLLVWNRDWQFWRSSHFAWGVAALAVIVLPWHLIQTYLYGTEFWDNYLFYHFIDRYTSAIEQNGAPFSYFFDQLLLYPALAMLAVASTAYVFVRSWKTKSYRIPLVALLVIFLIVSNSQTKLLGYAIPMYPFLALSIGSLLAHGLRLLKSAYLIVSLTAALVFTFVYFGFQMNEYKIAKAQANLSYEQSKQIGLLIKDLPNKDKQVIVGPYEYASLPALWYYAGKKLESLPQGMLEPDVSAAQRLKHTSSKSLYEFSNYYYISVRQYNP